MLFGIAALVSLIVGRLLHEPDLATLLLDSGGMDPTTPVQWLSLGLVVCLPGVIAIFVVWRAVWSALASADLLAMFTNFGARAPKPDDAEERQLVNVVSEIAIAAALPAPRVMLLDDDTINLAAVGNTPETATVFVTRGLLDRCNRSETQALVADAMAMIGNGDLRGMLRWIAVPMTLTIVRQLLQAPFFPPARAWLAPLRGRLWRRSSDLVGDAAAFAMLLGGAEPDAPNDLPDGRVRQALAFPFFMTHAMFNAVAFLASLLFLSPALTMLMRRRRYLSDAIAVQLTRQPDALTSAINRVIGQPLKPRTVPQLLELLFVAKPPNEFADSDRPLGLFFGTHPSLAKRHRRVAKMGLLGASDDPSQFAALARLTPGRRLLVGVLFALLVPLVGIAIYLMLYLIVALTLLSLVVGMMYVLVVVLPIRWLLGG